MRKILLFTSAVLILLSISLSTINSSYSRPEGAPFGNSGAPADNNRTCARSGCHSGSASARAGMITSNIPSSGYIPGETYEITVSIEQPGIAKWGFQISPQDLSGAVQGTLTLTDPARTRFIGTGNKYITQTTVGNSGAVNSTSWSFNWTAPSVGSGLVSFYGAVMASNGNGSTSGDQVFTDVLQIEEDLTTSIDDLRNVFSQIVYPNPLDGNVLTLKGFEINSNLVIRDLQGRVFSSIKIESSEDFNVVLNNLPQGVYFVQAINAKQSQAVRFVKN